MRKSIIVAAHTLRKWRNEYRVWLVFIVVAIFVANFCEPIYKLAQKWEYAVTPWVFPFIDSQPFMKMIMYLGLILIFSNAPFLNQDQVYVILRSGRKAYAVGQLLAILVMTMLYFLVLAVAPVLTHLNTTGWATEWGDVIFTAGNTGALMEIEGWANIIITFHLVDNLSAMEAMGLAYLLRVMTGVMLGYLVYMGNVLAKKQRWVGVLIAGMLVIIDPVFAAINRFEWSPVSWCDLNRLDYARIGNDLPVDSAIIRLAAIIVAAAVVCVVRMSRSEVQPIQE